MTDDYTIGGFDHCEFYVSNARQAAHYYSTAFGFQAVAYRGLETGSREKTSYLLQQDQIRLVFTAPLGPNSDIGRHIDRHGDGVKDVAFNVDNAAAAWDQAVHKGATSVLEPTTVSDQHGSAVLATIQTFGDTTHTFVQRGDYQGSFLPGYIPIDDPYPVADATGLVHIDHIVGNQPEDEMEAVVKWYEKVLNFHRFWTVDDEDISTEYSALRSIVVANANEKIKLPINEPAAGLKKSQIQEFIDYYLDGGVQHLALSTREIITTVTRLRANGVPFLPTPSSYYEGLTARVGTIDEDLEALARLGILVDRDEDGYLLQIFTTPLQDRPTLFFEIIQRKGAQSFGKGNFKALFESIEREQARRGNL